MCVSIHFTLSIRSVRLDLYNRYRITRLLLIFSLFSSICFLQLSIFYLFWHRQQRKQGERLNLFSERFKTWQASELHQTVCSHGSLLITCLLLFSLFSLLPFNLNLQSTHRDGVQGTQGQFFSRKTCKVPEMWVFCDPCCSVLRLGQLPTRHSPSQVSSCFILIL